MPLVKIDPLNQQHTITKDAWHPHSEGEPLHANSSIIDLAHWLAHKPELASDQFAIGLVINGDEDLSAFSSDLNHFKLISIHFPAFADGRGYSLARTLREKHHYIGEIRAVGDILPDQALYLARVGFSTLELANEKLALLAIKKLSEYSVFYQPSNV